MLPITSSALVSIEYFAIVLVVANNSLDCFINHSVFQDALGNERVRNIQMTLDEFFLDTASINQIADNAEIVNVAVLCLFTDGDREEDPS